MDRIVIDTSVFISALISRRGASFRLLQLVGTGKFQSCVSVPLVLEYEATARRLIGTRITLTPQQISDVIDYFCAISEHSSVYFLWRPMLRDPDDEMVLELAISAECGFIVTHNARDFQGAERFGVEVVAPHTYLQRIGESK